MRFASHQISKPMTGSPGVEAGSAEIQGILRFRRQLAASCLLFALLIASAPLAAGLPAFPGAEGGGALAVGGRGGAVCKVTNLDDSGPGSLRNCIEMEGPRIVIFAVGGTIKLKNRLRIQNPYITIAGQTAPGGGIQLKADKDGYDRGDLLIIDADHVVVRFLRIRTGYTPLSIGSIRVVSSSNIIVDHVSMAWSTNQNWSFAPWTNNGPSNVTLQNSIVTDMIDGRVNMLIGTQNPRTINMTNLDHHNNFIANSSHRNPLAGHRSGRWVNNIIYHWTSWASRSIGGVEHDWVSNLWRPGPTAPGGRGQHELQFIPSHYEYNGHELVYSSGRTLEPNLDRIIEGNPSVYVEGNRGYQSGMSPDEDNWPYTRVSGYEAATQILHHNGHPMEVPPVEWRRHHPLPDTPIPITARHVNELEDYLLPIVGASKRLDCDGNWVPNRDAADQRAIDEYLNNEGRISTGGEGEEIYGGHPYLAAGTACLDTSGDGVPDQWAIANGLDPEDPMLGARLHDSGYTFLELYLNGLQLNLARPSRVTITVE